MTTIGEQVSIGPYLAGMIRELEGAGRDARADMLRAGRPNAFPSSPEPTCKMWDRLQTMDARTLLVTHVLDPRPGTSTVWARTVREVCTRVETYGAGGLFQNLRSRDNGISRTAHARRILFPRQKLMRLLQDSESLEDAELVRRGGVYAEKYKRRFVDGVDSGSTLEDDLSLMEMFHDVVVLDTKWSQEVLFRCICKECMKSAVCVHALLCGMVCDPSIQIPEEYLHTKLQLRRSRGRPSKRRLHEVSDAVEGGCRGTVPMPAGHRLPAVQYSVQEHACATCRHC